jgi:hypothetical protein
MDTAFLLSEFIRGWIVLVAVPPRCAVSRISNPQSRRTHNASRRANATPTGSRRYSRLETVGNLRYTPTPLKRLPPRDDLRHWAKATSKDGFSGQALWLGLGHSQILHDERRELGVKMRRDASLEPGADPVVIPLDHLAYRVQTRDHRRLAVRHF